MKLFTGCTTEDGRVRVAHGLAASPVGVITQPTKAMQELVPGLVAKVGAVDDESFTVRFLYPAPACGCCNHVSFVPFASATVELAWHAVSDEKREAGK